MDHRLYKKVRLLCSWVLACTLGAPAVLRAADPKEQIVVAVGNNVGYPGEEPLRFAQKDAKRFAEVFVDLGWAKPDRAYVLRAKKPSDVKRLLIEIKGRVTELKALGVHVTLLFYYAGHGDQSVLHMGSQGLIVKELKDDLEGISADISLIFIDSCRSVGASRGLGVVRGPEFDVNLWIPSTRGTIVVRSASLGEPAHESDELRGAVFSHYLLSGLRGPADLDRDNQISFHEAYTFAYSRTLLRTAGGQGALQHPAFDVEVEGDGPIVLTRTRRSNAFLVFAKDCEDCQTRYLVYSLPSRNVIAEVPARLDGDTTLAVPSGRFLVQRRSKSQAGIAHVELPWGGSRQIDLDDFTPVEYQRLSMLGGDILAQGLKVGISYRTEIISRGQMNWGQGAGLSTGYLWGRFLLNFMLSFGHSFLTYPQHTGNEYRLGFVPTASYLVIGSWYTLKLGAGVAVEPTWQVLVHKESDRIRAAGLDPQKRFWSTTIGPVCLVGASISLSSGWVLEAELSGKVGWTGRTSENGVDIGLRGGGALSLGFSYTF